MRKFQLKKKIAGVLAASMVLTSLAPAVPAYAFTHKDISFDLGIYTAYEGANLPALVADDTNTIMVKYPTYQVDTGSNGQSPTSVTPATNLEMPWWEVDWDGFNAGGGTKPTPTWGGTSFGFAGYALEGWYAKPYEDDPTQARVNKLPKNFPVSTSDGTYYAHYVSDGEEYNLKIHHLPQGGSSAPISETTSDNYKTLVSIQARPKVVQGYKATLQDSDIKMYEKGTTTAAPHSFTDYGFVKDTDQNVTGAIVNKDMDVTYYYAVDPSVVFSVTSNHVLLKADGSVDTTTTEHSSFTAESPISGIGPKTDLITPQGSETQPRYNLVVADNVPVAAPDVKAPVLTSGTTADPVRYIAAYAGGFDTNYNLTGNMPNQGIGVTYTYIPNPLYTIAVTVKYVNEDGASITSDVLAATGAPYTETSDNAIVMPVGINGTANAPYPDLDGYGAPVYSATEGGLDLAGVVENYVSGATTGTCDITLLSEPATIQITYSRDPAAWEQVLIRQEGEGGKLMDADNPTSEYSNMQAMPISLQKDGSGNVSIDPSILPIPAKLDGTLNQTEVGYDFDGWYIGSDVTNPANKITGIVSIGSPYTLTAHFTKSSAWKTYSFQFEGSNGSMSPAGPVAVEVLPLDALGNTRAIPWSDMDPAGAPTTEFAGKVPDVAPDTGFDVKWYDAGGNEVTATTDMAGYADGAVFTAYCVAAGPLSLNTPTAVGSIDSTNGAAGITVSNFNSDPSVYYAVTDASGNIVSLIRNNVLQSQAGVISSGLYPDTTYNVYEVDPSAVSGGLVVGDPISSAPAGTTSSPAAATTPVCVTPEISIDPNDPASNQITINPTTPGCQYAIVDSTGTTVVADWTTPTGGVVTFPGLTPDETYKIVVKQDTATDTPTSRAPGMDVVVTTGVGRNTITITNMADLASVDPAGLDFNNVPTGTVVTVQANPTSGGDIFSRWIAVLGTPTGVSVTGSYYRFTMPAGNVVLEASYNNGVASWSDAVYTNTIGDGKQVGVVNPPITDPGAYRVILDKHSVPAAVKTNIEGQESDPYTGLWELSIKVEQSLDGGISWHDYTGTVPDITTYVNTGALNAERTYSLYEVASGSDASKMSGSFETDWTSPSYTGSFAADLVNGNRYVFGYTQPPTHLIKIRDGRDDVLVASLRIPLMNTVNDFFGAFSSHVVPDYIDVNGISWHYEGLSDSRTTFNEFDGNGMVTSDDTLYLFYSSDRPERNQAVTDLTGAIGTANGLLSQVYPSYQPTLQAAIDAANAVLNQTLPRKASTAELQAALAALQNAITTARRFVKGSGSSSGGSSSGGSGITSGLTSTSTSNGYPTYTVGTNGNWDNIEQPTHKWVFNLNNGTRVTGWANLRYTYDGTTRVDTYHFAEDGIMSSGWYQDAVGTWYYFSEVHDGFFGRQVKGWYKDAQDSNWYYLASDGHMLTGWQNISNKWYYLTPSNQAPTWTYNEAERFWIYTDGNGQRPMGSMYCNERTPDNYTVDASGAWVN